MPTRSSKPREQAIGEIAWSTKESWTAPCCPLRTKARTLLPWRSGGKARAEALSPRKRSAIAKKAAKARWGKA